MFSEWQPIATAPKDGTIILIFEGRVGTAAGIVRVSRWRDDTIPSGWTGAENPPSHWLPLPLPPKRLSFVSAGPWMPIDTAAAKDTAEQSLSENGREARADADAAKLPTMDEAPRSAGDIAQSPNLLSNDSP